MKNQFPVGSVAKEKTMVRRLNRSVCCLVRHATVAITIAMLPGISLAQTAAGARYLGDSNDPRCANIPQLPKGQTAVPKVIRYVNDSAETIDLRPDASGGRAYALAPGQSIEIQLFDDQGMVWDPTPNRRSDFRARSTAGNAINNCYVLRPDLSAEPVVERKRYYEKPIERKRYYEKPVQKKRYYAGQQDGTGQTAPPTQQQRYTAPVQGQQRQRYAPALQQQQRYAPPVEGQTGTRTTPLPQTQQTGTRGLPQNTNDQTGTRALPQNAGDQTGTRGLPPTTDNEKQGQGGGAKGKKTKPDLSALDPKNRHGLAYQPEQGNERGCRATIEAQYLLPLATGQSLKVGQKYCSSGGDYVLRMNPDGNLVINDAATDNYRWGLDRQPGLTLQRDSTAAFNAPGQLVISNKAGGKVWAFPDAAPSKGGYLDVLPTGKLAIVDGAGDVVHPDQSNFLSTKEKPGDSTQCATKEGYSFCLELAKPKIQIHGSKKATLKVGHAVARVYTVMFEKIGSEELKKKFDGFQVYLTNGESMEELDALDGVNKFFGKVERAQIRGGANVRRLWISEQMICQKGVPTRNVDFKAGRATQGDDSWRSFDQVVHEMAHSIDRNVPGGLLREKAAYNWLAQKGEEVAFDVQQLFNVITPPREIPADRLEVIKSVFTGGGASFKCDSKRPLGLVAAALAKRPESDDQSKKAKDSGEAAKKDAGDGEKKPALTEMPKNVAEPEAVPAGAPLPDAAKMTFTPSDAPKTLPGKATEFKPGAWGCAKSRDIPEADNVGDLGIVVEVDTSGGDSPGCFSDGRYNNGDYQVEPGKFESSSLPGTVFPSFKVEPPKKKATDFLLSKHKLAYKFAERKDHTVYALIGDSLKKVADVPAAEIVPGEFSKIGGFEISKLSQPVTYVIAPNDAVLSPLAKLSDGVQGAKIADTPQGTWETYRHKVNGTPFDTARSYTAGPDDWANRYSQLRRFFPVHLKDQAGVIWQDQKNDKVYLQKFSTDLRSSETVELQSRPGFALAAAASDDDSKVFYFLVQKGGLPKPTNVARALVLYSANASGGDTQQKQFSGAQGAFDVSAFYGKPDGVEDLNVADMEYSNGKLGLMFGRQKMRGGDGLQHQSGTAHVFDANSLNELKNLNQTSGHSFENVLTVGPSGKFVGIDLGDNYPRGVHLHRFDESKRDGQVVFTFKTLHGNKPNAPDGRSYPPYGNGYYRWSNDNNTYTELGGVVASPDGFLTAFVGEPDGAGRALRNDRTGRDDKGGEKHLVDARNVGLVKVGKEIGKDNPVLSKGVNEQGSYYAFNGTTRNQSNKGIVWLTKYSDPKRENASRLKAANLPDGNVLLAWETWTPKTYVSTHSMKVSKDGAPVGAPYELGSKVRLSRRGNPLTMGKTVLFVSGDALTGELIVTAFKSGG